MRGRKWHYPNLWVKIGMVNYRGDWWYSLVQNNGDLAA